jgi:hypothetical protein
MAITAPRNPYAACPVAGGALLTALYDNHRNTRNQQDLRQLQAASAAAYERRAVETHQFGPQPWQCFDAWVRRVKAFNFSSVVSMGPHTTSAGGHHKHAIPRVVAAVTRPLMQEQAGALPPALQACDEQELRPWERQA